LRFFPFPLTWQVPVQQVPPQGVPQVPVVELQHWPEGQQVEPQLVPPFGQTQLPF
jgi:hypothetical protein